MLLNSSLVLRLQRTSVQRSGQLCSHVCVCVLYLLCIVFPISVLMLRTSEHSECVCDTVCLSVSFQFDDLGILRTHFFQVVRNHNIPEDTQERFDILRVLTLDGKNILHLEQDVGEDKHHRQDGWRTC